MTQPASAVSSSPGSRAPRGRRWASIVSLTFDDGLADHVEVGLLLCRYGLRGTFYVSSARLGTPGYMSWSQLTELAHDGHEIGGHTLDHVKLTTVPETAARRQIAADREALLDHGFAAASFAYPYGAVDDVTRRLVAEAGYSSGRRAWGLSERRGDGQPVAETLPPPDAYAIRTAPSIRTGTTVGALRALVLRVERRGGWLQLVFHHVGPEAGDLTVEPETLAAFLRWLAARGGSGASVETVGDVVSHYGPSSGEL